MANHQGNGVFHLPWWAAPTAHRRDSDLVVHVETRRYVTIMRRERELALRALSLLPRQPRGVLAV